MFVVSGRKKMKCAYRAMYTITLHMLTVGLLLSLEALQKDNIEIDVKTKTYVVALRLRMNPS